MNCIDVTEYRAFFFVETVHEQNLEFVLTDAEDRTGTEYAMRLWDMFHDEFRHEPDTDVISYGAYGGVYFTLHAPSPEQLQQALDRCDRVVRRWIAKYQINRLKGSTLT